VGTGQAVYNTILSLNTSLQGNVVQNMTSYLAVVY
jgi:hypothetical protein